MFDTGWSPEKEREPRCKAEKLPTNGPMKTRRGMGSVFCFLFQENFRDVYIILYIYIMMLYIYTYTYMCVYILRKWKYMIVLYICICRCICIKIHTPKGFVAVRLSMLFGLLTLKPTDLLMMRSSLLLPMSVAMSNLEVLLTLSFQDILAPSTNRSRIILSHDQTQAIFHTLLP
jgi:hypothetical protein